ncbi:MAG: hypothetical protein HY427_03720 [Candidatus Levybacteria bacterium]|nr:hypothetical protein [Candidatus Levybacteria bacterium]
MVTWEGPDQTATASATGKAGPLFTVNTADRKITSVVKDSNSTATTAYIYIKTTAGNGTFVASGLFSTNTATFNDNISTSNTYYIIADSAGATYTRSELATGGFPFTGTDLTATASTRFSGGADFTDQIENIFQVVTEAQQVNVTVTPLTLTLSTTSKIPDIQVLFAMSSALSLTLGVNSPTINIKKEGQSEGTGTINTRFIRSKVYDDDDKISLRPKNNPLKYENKERQNRKTSSWSA